MEMNRERKAEPEWARRFDVMWADLERQFAEAKDVFREYPVIGEKREYMTENEKADLAETTGKAIKEIEQLKQFADAGDADAASQLEHLARRLDKLEHKAVLRLKQNLEKELGRKPTNEEILARANELKQGND